MMALKGGSQESEDRNGAIGTSDIEGKVAQGSGEQGRSRVNQTGNRNSEIGTAPSRTCHSSLATCSPTDESAVVGHASQIPI
jgi:hypothetical protein